MSQDQYCTSVYRRMIQKLLGKHQEDGYFTDEELTTLYTQLAIALVWLGKGEEAERYHIKALEMATTTREV